MGEGKSFRSKMEKKNRKKNKVVKAKKKKGNEIQKDEPKKA